MDTLWRLVSLGGIAVLYGLLAIGIKKYRIKDTVKRLTKKEMLAMAAGIGLLCLGILLQSARVPMEMGSGVVSDSVYWAAGVCFAGNATAVSFAIAVVVLAPAVLYQVLFLEQLVMKSRIPYCQMYYFLMLYVFAAGLYRNLSAGPGELLLLLTVSALLYYGVRVIGGNGNKKDMIYLLCFAAGIVALSLLERPLHWQLYAVCGIVMLESLVMALFRGYSVILRKTLRRLGTLLLFVFFIGLNYWLW